MKNVSISGLWDPDQNNQGSRTIYNGNTDSLGLYYVTDGRAPAYWDHYAIWPMWCGQRFFEGGQGDNLFHYMQVHYWTDNQATVPWDCVETTVPGASQRFSIQGALPSSVTLEGVLPFTTMSGMPTMTVYDGVPSVVTTVTASSVSADGSTATFPFPSSLATKAYGIALDNILEDGTTQPAGFNFMSVANSQSISGRPFGVAVATQQNRQTNTIACGSHHTTSSTTNKITKPVVTLNGSNQVLVDGTTVAVGANPTAVVLYAGPIESLNLGDPEGCITSTSTFSGQTRAVVTNSGDSSISVIDIVTDQLLHSITVGAAPVAVAVAPDNTTAYVANYADHTLSKVSLSAGVATATVSLADAPTSVVITASGLLYVGGTSFLAQVDPSSMSVIASQSTPRSIVGLSYSNTVAQLVATTADTNGAIYSEDIAPASISSSSSYAALGVHAISNMGTYASSSTGNTYKAFTAMAVNRGLANLAQVGAPPLVVQDGWAVFLRHQQAFRLRI